MRTQEKDHEKIQRPHNSPVSRRDNYGVLTAPWSAYSSGQSKQKRKVSVVNTETVSRKHQREEQREQDTWQTDHKASTMEEPASSHEKIMKTWDNVMTNIKLAEGADLEELLDELDTMDQFRFDEDEKETLKLMRIDKRVAPPRQLGDWITINIDSSTQLVSCNCKRCNTYEKCGWVCVFEVLQFGVDPPSSCKNSDNGFACCMERACDACPS